MKRISITLLFVLCVCVIAACGDESPAATGTSGSNATSVSAASDTSAVSEVEKETVSTPVSVHEHVFEYVSEGDFIHVKKCKDSTCDYKETEDCTLNAEYKCEYCEFLHEHTLDVVSNEDGTHKKICSSEKCDYTEEGTCSLDEAYTCAECGWIHEHSLVYTTSEDGKTHTGTCQLTELCNYEETSECTIEHLKCDTCGYEVPWKDNLKPSEDHGYWQAGTYYAQKKIPVYSTPDSTTEPVRYLETNDSFNLKWRYLNENINEEFLISDSYECISCGDIGFTFSTNRFDLRMGKTTQVVVSKSVLHGNYWTRKGVVGVYNSYDEATQAIVGTPWSTIQSTWNYITYPDLPFMPSYSDGAFTSVSTRNGRYPYSYAVGALEDGAIDYYFE